MKGIISFMESYDSLHNRLIFSPRNDPARDLLDLLDVREYLTEDQYDKVSNFLESVGADIQLCDDPSEKKLY